MRGPDGNGRRMRCKLNETHAKAHDCQPTHLCLRQMAETEAVPAHGDIQHAKAVLLVGAGRYLRPPGRCVVSINTVAVLSHGHRAVCDAIGGGRGQYLAHVRTREPDRERGQRRLFRASRGGEAGG